MAEQHDERSSLLGTDAFCAFLARSDACTDAYGRSLLHLAAQREGLGVVRALLAAGCDPNARTSEPTASDVVGLGQAWAIDCTPLMEAACMGRLDNIAALLDCGAVELMAVNSHGIAALHYAASLPIGTRSEAERALACTQLLLDAGADVNARGSCGETPLHEAATSRPGPAEGSSSEDHAMSGAVVQLLLDRGASVNARDVHGTTPLLLAVSTGTCAAVEALLAAGARVSMAGILHPAARSSQCDLGAPITPLGAALRRGHAGIIGALLAAGADLGRAHLSGQQRRELGAMLGVQLRELRQLRKLHEQCVQHEERVTPELREVVVKMACERKRLEQQRLAQLRSKRAAAVAPAAGAGYGAKRGGGGRWHSFRTAAAAE